MSASFTVRDVLDLLDEDARSAPAFFPDLEHGYNYHVDARLNIYGDGSRWAVIIEQLHVNPRWGSFAGVGVAVSFHGNCIDLSAEPDAGRHDLITIADILSNGPGEPLLTEDSDTINPAAEYVRIRGQVVPIRTDEDYYWARKIDVHRLTHKQIDEMIVNAKKFLPPDQANLQASAYEELRSHVGKFEPRTWHLLRGLVPEYRDRLLASEPERRRGLPDDLPLLLQIDDWDHPRLMDGELPSGCSSFRQIAKVLQKQDPTLWQFEEGDGNVHWRNWPMSGSL